MKKTTILQNLSVLLCAASALSLQAQTPATLYHNTATAGAMTATGVWSPTPALGANQNWVNGDYAYFGVSGANMPTGITWSGVDTPGVTFDAQGVATTITVHASTLKMDSDTTNHPGYCSLMLINKVTVFAQNSGSLFFKPNPALAPLTPGLYLGGDGTSEMFFGLTTGGLTGNLWIGEGGAIIVTTAATLPVADTIILGDNATPSTPNYAIFRGGISGGSATTYTVNNPVILQGNTELANGSGDNHLAFAGGVSVPVQVNLACNANQVNFNSVISGAGGLNFVPCPLNGAGWGVMSLNSANTYSGGTTVSTVGSTLVANASGALGSGPVTLNLAPGTGLQLNFQDTMSPNATLDIEGTVGSGQVNLNYAGNQNLAGLTVTGVQLAPGVYSTALNPLGVFTGSGTITVTGPYANSVLITSQTVAANQLTVCWSSVAGAAYNVLTNVGLGTVPQVWGPANAAPIPSQGSTTCYTLPGNVSSNSQVFVTVKQQ